MNYTMQLAIVDFGMGCLTKFTIERMIIDKAGWFILLSDDSNPMGSLVDTFTKKASIFKTIDAAVSALQEIGFEINTLKN